jgi:hypothetical protein
MKRHHTSYINYQKAAMFEEAHDRPHPMGDNPLLHCTAKTIIHSEAFSSLSMEILNTLSVVFNQSMDIYDAISQFSAIDLSQIDINGKGRTDVSLEYANANVIYSPQHPSMTLRPVSEYIRFLTEEAESVQVGSLLRYYEDLSKDVYPKTLLAANAYYDIDNAIMTCMMEMVAELGLSTNDLENFTVIVPPVMVSLLQSSRTFNYKPGPVGSFRGAKHLMKVGNSGNHGFGLYSYIDFSNDKDDGQSIYIIYCDPSDPHMVYTPKYPVYSNIELPSYSLGDVTVYISSIKEEDFVTLRPDAEKTVRMLKFKYE